ncbi:MAG: helix-turn-helix domain-containing protein [Terriglobia bacterium]|nr:helix-turn-helix domain-containing protein [Terriglobia bacterium]
MGRKATRPARMSASTVKSAARVLEIFEHFDEVRRPVTIHEVAQALGYPHSSTTALLKSLVSLGYLEYSTQRKTFFPSIRISMLGNWIEAEALPIRNVHRMMNHLSEQTACTIILATRVGIHAQYLKVIQGTTDIRFHVKPSTKRNLAFSTIGRVLLSGLSPLEAKPLIKDALAAVPAATETVASIEAELRTVKKRGYAIYSGLVTANAMMLAMPIGDKSLKRPIAIGIAAPKEYFRENKERFITLMKRAIAEHISGNGHQARWPDDDASRTPVNT